MGTEKPRPLASQRFRRNVRTFDAWLLSVLILMAGPLVAEWLLDCGTVAARAAAAFGGVVLLRTRLAWLERAGFVEHPDLRLLGGSFFLVWLVTVLGAKFYFERTA